MTKPKNEPVIFKEIQKSETQMIRIWRNIYKDRELYCIQNFYRDTPLDDWAFGKATTFHPEVIDDLIEGLQMMQKWYEDNI